MAEGSKNAASSHHLALVIAGESISRQLVKHHQCAAFWRADSACASSAAYQRHAGVEAKMEMNNHQAAKRRARLRRNRGGFHRARSSALAL